MVWELISHSTDNFNLWISSQQTIFPLLSRQSAIRCDKIVRLPTFLSVTKEIGIAALYSSTPKVRNLNGLWRGHENPKLRRFSSPVPVTDHKSQVPVYMYRYNVVNVNVTVLVIQSLERELRAVVLMGKGVPLRMPARMPNSHSSFQL